VRTTAQIRLGYEWSFRNSTLVCSKIKRMSPIILPLPGRPLLLHYMTCQQQLLNRVYGRQSFSPYLCKYQSGLNQVPLRTQNIMVLSLSIFVHNSLGIPSFIFTAERYLFNSLLARTFKFVAITHYASLVFAYNYHKESVIRTTMLTFTNRLSHSSEVHSRFPVQLTKESCNAAQHRIRLDGLLPCWNNSMLGVFNKSTDLLAS
jgi:hypothetical protein